MLNDSPASASLKASVTYTQYQKDLAFDEALQNWKLKETVTETERILLARFDMVNISKYPHEFGCCAEGPDCTIPVKEQTFKEGLSVIVKSALDTRITEPKLHVTMQKHALDLLCWRHQRNGQVAFELGVKLRDISLKVRDEMLHESYCFKSGCERCPKR